MKILATVISLFLLASAATALPRCFEEDLAGRIADKTQKPKPTTLYLRQCKFNGGICLWAFSAKDVQYPISEIDPSAGRATLQVPTVSYQVVMRENEGYPLLLQPMQPAQLSLGPPFFGSKGEWLRTKRLGGFCATKSPTSNILVATACRRGAKYPSLVNKREEGKPAIVDLQGLKYRLRGAINDMVKGPDGKPTGYSIYLEQCQM